MAKACLSPRHFSFLCLLQLGLSQPPPHGHPQPGSGYWRAGIKGRRGVWLEPQISGSQTLALLTEASPPLFLASPALPLRHPRLSLCRPWKGLTCSSQGLLPRGASPLQENPYREAGLGHLRPDFRKSVVVVVTTAGNASPALPASRVLSYTRDVRHLFFTTGPCPVPAPQLPPGNRGRQETSKSLRPSALGLLVLAQ